MKRNNILRWAIFFFIAFFLAASNLNDASVIQNDANVSQLVINNQVSWMTSFCSVLSVIFEPIYVIIFVLILSVILWIRQFRKEAVFLVFVSSCAGILIYLLKHLFVRIRPTMVFTSVGGYSFPSGHALIAVVLFGSLIYFSFRIKSISVKISLIVFSYLGILVLGLSRVYLNVHWFSDILGGFFLGATVLLVGIVMY
ncbi:MAG: phosphatase PAP2 family protein, partial [archaeon]